MKLKSVKKINKGVFKNSDYKLLFNIINPSVGAKLKILK